MSLLESKQLTIFTGNDYLFINKLAGEIYRKMPYDKIMLLGDIDYIITKFKHIDKPYILLKYPECGYSPNDRTEIAKMIIQHINNGKHIILLTQSDDMFQHFSNMIKLYNNPKRYQNKFIKKYNYEKLDILDPNKVICYDVNDGISINTQISKYGIHVYSIRQHLDNVSNEIDDLLEHIKD